MDGHDRRYDDDLLSLLFQPVIPAQHASARIADSLTTSTSLVKRAPRAGCLHWTLRTAISINSAAWLAARVGGIGGMPFDPWENAALH